MLKLCYDLNARVQLANCSAKIYFFLNLYEKIQCRKNVAETSKKIAEKNLFEAIDMSLNRKINLFLKIYPKLTIFKPA